MRSQMKRAAVVLVGAGALAIGVPAAADAATKVAPDTALPVAKATKLQRQAARRGHYPAGPKVSVKGRKKSVPAKRAAGKARAPKGATRIHIKGKRLARTRSGSVKANASLFGYEGDFFAKRNTILANVQGFYEGLVPKSGGTFTAPALYEVNDDTTTVTCGTESKVYRQNASYCPPGNFVVWSIELSQSLWTGIGDTAWGTAIAHEYGHGAQKWLGYGNGGWFGYTIYREGFADCMAGAWLVSIYQNNQAGNVGRGDGQEFTDLFHRVADPTTTWDNHGDFNWRDQAALYGWNYGFDGCVSWGNWIYNH
jgi:hypothetical protein